MHSWSCSRVEQSDTFVAAVNPIERAVLQLTVSATLLPIGFIFGTELEEA